jgi:hypothetical protein
MRISGAAAVRILSIRKEVVVVTIATARTHLNAESSDGRKIPRAGNAVHDFDAYPIILQEKKEQ